MDYKGTIHQGGYRNTEMPMNSEGGVNEISVRNEHETIAKHIAEKLAADLNINYGDRTFVERLLFSSIKEMVRDLLKEYENVVADKIHENIKSNLEHEYDINLDSKVDYTHAAHAKLSTFMKEVKEKLITNKNQK